MPNHHVNFDPQDSDFEQSAQGIVELDPKLQKVRGASNRDGDDGLYRNRETGELLTLEAKHLRQQNPLAKRYVDNLNEAAARNAEMYDAPSRRVLVTTSGSLAQGTKKKLKQLEEDGTPVEILGYGDIEQIAQDPSTPADLAFALKKSLAKKARRTKE
jgi:hypothetical protein